MSAPKYYHLFVGDSFVRRIEASEIAAYFNVHRSHGVVIIEEEKDAKNARVELGIDLVTKSR